MFKKDESMVDLPEKVFYKAAKVSKQQALDSFVFCYNKHNNIRNSQSYAANGFESDKKEA